MKGEKIAAQAVAQEALDTAKAKEVDSEQGLKQAQQVKDSLEATHQEMYRNMDGTSEMEAIAEHGLTDEGLQKARQALNTFTELFERKAPTADVTMGEAEVTTEASTMETSEAA